MTFELTNVTVTTGGHTVLSNVCTEFRSSDVTLVTGATGIGKSTLLRLLSAHIIPTSGSVSVNGLSTSTMNRKARLQLQSSVALLQQHPLLIPTFTVSQNIQSVLAAQGMAKAHAIRTTLELAAEVGLSHCREKLPSQLSGGEQQLAYLARVLALQPTTLLADEPSTMLDTDTLARVATAINVRIGRGMGLVVCSHSARFASLLPIHNRLQIEAGAIINQQMPNT